MTTLQSLVLNTLDNVKANNTNTLYVSSLTDVADYLIITTGTSTTHVAAMAEAIVQAVKAKNIMPIGVEGSPGANWILVDLGSVIVHIMLKETREFYALDKLWATETQIQEELASM